MLHLAHLTHFESPTLALAYLGGLATGVVVTLLFARWRAR